MNKDVMNSLAIACKKYIENSRQELRISIALARNPNFQGELKTELDENISQVQKKIIERCIKIYKFVDYLQVARKDVSLKFVNHQISKSVLNALLYKLKADMMCYLYECLSGENGLLQYLDVDHKNIEDFKAFGATKRLLDLGVDEDGIDKKDGFKQELKYWWDSSYAKFYSEHQTLQEFFKHEVKA